MHLFPHAFICGNKCIDIISYIHYIQGPNYSYKRIAYLCILNRETYEFEEMKKSKENEYDMNCSRFIFFRRVILFVLFNKVQSVRKKDTHHFVSFFKARASIFFQTCHTCRLKNGKKDECKINAFAMLSNIDKAFCVESYFSTKSFSETPHQETGLGPQEDSPGAEQSHQQMGGGIQR